MKQLIIIIAALSLLSACSRLPNIVEDSTRQPKPSEQSCRMSFPQGKWQLQHAIEATVRGRQMGKLIGAMVLSSKERTIQCALMTIEGMVLFSAQYDGQLTVDRAVKPFDRPGFAGGLMDDLMLMFFAPEGQGQVGRTLDGDEICRYPYPENFVTDIIVHDPDRWMINRYDTRGRLLRTVSVDRGNTARYAGRSGIAQYITLESRSGDDYRLELTLIGVVPLKPEQGLNENSTAIHPHPGPPPSRGMGLRIINH
jgi:hypothetical protein